jgi:hypothetical protein
VELESREQDTEVIPDDAEQSDSLSPFFTSASSDDDSVLPPLSDERCSTSNTSSSDSMLTVCDETHATTDNVAPVTTMILTQAQAKDPPFFKIVGDNIDKTVKPREETSDNHNKSLHYFHSYAVRDRTNAYGLEDNPHLPNIEDINILDVLQTDDDRNILKKNMSIIAGKLGINVMCNFYVDFRKNC